MTVPQAYVLRSGLNVWLCLQMPLTKLRQQSGAGTGAAAGQRQGQRLGEGQGEGQRQTLKYRDTFQFFEL